VRKVVFIVIALVMVFMLLAPVMAQELMRVRGTVTKIDTETMSVTIEPEGGAKVTVIMGNAESLSMVKVGETVESRYTVTEGKNIGKRLRKVSEGCE
jgi:hypothetical protein